MLSAYKPKIKKAGVRLIDLPARIFAPGALAGSAVTIKPRVEIFDNNDLTGRSGI